MSTLHVAIVGGGIGGLAAANALSRRGIDVAVYEQAGRLGEVGAGIGLSRNSLRLLERLGLGDPIRSASAPIAEMRVRDCHGELVSVQSPEASDGGLRGIYRPDLVEILVESLPDVTVATGRRCIGFSQNADHATLIFDNGERAVADVVVAADGIHSFLQHYVVPPSDPVFSGSIVYRGVMQASRIPEYPADKGTMWMGDGRHFIVFPMRGGQLINYAGFVPSDAQMRESWSAPGDPAMLAAEFAGWDPALRHIINQVDTTFRWGLYDREPLSRWTDGRLTLLGDAAHPMLPHLGQGANQAIEDAVALATLLSGLGGDGAPQALLRYETLRWSRTAPIQHNSRVNGLLYESAAIADRDHKIGDVFSRMQADFDYDVEAEAEAARG